MYIPDELLRELYTKDKDKLNLLLGLYLKADKDGVIITSRSEMVRFTGLTERKYRTNIAKLDNVQVNVQGTTKITFSDIDSYRVMRPANVLDDVQLKGKESKQKEKSPTTPIKKEKDKEKENSLIKTCVRKNFIPPTIDEVKAYIAEKGWHIDADSWWNFYNAKNWMIGKNKMVKWKSAVATWNRTQYHSATINPTSEIGQIFRQEETDYTQGWD